MCVCFDKVHLKGSEYPLVTILYKMVSVNRSAQLILFQSKVEQVGEYLPSQFQDMVA